MVALTLFSRLSIFSVFEGFMSVAKTLNMAAGAYRKLRRMYSHSDSATIWEISRDFRSTTENVCKACCAHLTCCTRSLVCSVRNLPVFVGFALSVIFAWSKPSQQSVLVMRPLCAKTITQLLASKRRAHAKWWDPLNDVRKC